jgi:hypothetical protein
MLDFLKLLYNHAVQEGDGEEEGEDREGEREQDNTPNNYSPSTQTNFLYQTSKKGDLLHTHQQLHSISQSGQERTPAQQTVYSTNAEIELSCLT